MHITIPYGDETIGFEVPAECPAAVLAPRPVQGAADPRGEIRRALDAPIGARPLREAVRGARSVAILADVLVKHAVPLGPLTIEDAARDAVERRYADALIVTGVGTGHATDLADVRRVRAALPDTPILVGSGVDEHNVRDTFALADGAIIGTAFKQGGKTTNPVELARVRRLVAAAKG